MTAPADIGSRLVDLIRDRLSVDVPGIEADLIDSGLLDSLALVTLIAALEETYACELPLDDFTLDNFRSVDRIAKFLHSTGVLDARDSW